MLCCSILLFMIDNIREKQAVAEVVPSSCQSSARFSFFDGLDFSLSYFLFTINLKNKFGPKSVVQTKFWSKIIKVPKKLGPKSVVNIGSVSAEIYLIWSQMSLEQMLP